MTQRCTRSIWIDGRGGGVGRNSGSIRTAAGHGGCAQELAELCTRMMIEDLTILGAFLASSVTLAIKNSRIRIGISFEYDDRMRAASESTQMRNWCIGGLLKRQLRFYWRRTPFVTRWRLHRTEI